MSAPGNIRRLRSGGKDNWRTPVPLFEAVSRRLRGINFAVDLAADAENHLCPSWFSEEDDALSIQWNSLRWGGWGWCNPPYSLTKEFVAKAISSGTGVVMLVPAATDTRWWAEAFDAADVTLLLTGRVSFVDPVTEKPMSGNTTGSTIFVFGGMFGKAVGTWDWKKDILSR